MRWLLLLLCLPCCGSHVCEGRVIDACRKACSADYQLPAENQCLTYCVAASVARCQLAAKGG